MRTPFHSFEPRSGQAMLIAILTLGGAILGATAIAGFLLLYDIRSTTDSVNSAKAIFAADSGTDWALYSYFHPPSPTSTSPELSNGATVVVTCYDASGSSTACDGTGSTAPAEAIAEGSSLGSRRAFLTELATGTSTLP